MTSESSNEPRKVPLRIRLPFTTEEEFIERYGANVTRGGIFIATRHGKPVGTPLSFELVLQDGVRLMRGEGVVQKLLVDEQAGKSGMLVRFTRIDTRTKGLIDLILERREGLKNPEPPVATTTQPPPPSAPPVAKPPPAPVPQKKGPIALGDDVVLGIDLGTTTCRAAVVIDGTPKLVPIASERGAFALPSIVAYDVAKDRVLIGSAARKHRVDHPDQAVIGFKRLMGRRAQSKKVRELAKVSPYTFASDPEGDVGIELMGRVFSIAEFASHLLKELKNAAQDFLGRELTRAVLCVPAWYTDHQRAAVLTSGQLAGLDVVSILNEPSAVALAFGFGRGLARKRVLVYDLGGGTFDASVVEITGDDLEAVSTGGDNFLGRHGLRRPPRRRADRHDGRGPQGAAAAVAHDDGARARRRRGGEDRAVRQGARAGARALRHHRRRRQAGRSPVEVERGFLESATQDLGRAHRAGDPGGARGRQALTRRASTRCCWSAASRARRRCVSTSRSVLGRAGRTDVDPAGAVALGAALLGHSLVQKERGKRGPLARRGPLVAHRRGGEGRRLPAHPRAQHPPARREDRSPCRCRRSRPSSSP